MKALSQRTARVMNKLREAHDVAQHFEAYKRDKSIPKDVYLMALEIAYRNATGLNMKGGI